MGDAGFRILQAVFSLVWHCDLRGFRDPPGGAPRVFVSNHLGSYAPLALLASFPGRLYPWVDHQIVDWKLCAQYLRDDFVERELHVPRPLSSALAWLISTPCVMLMRTIRAVPVHPRSMKGTLTWRRSLELLKRGERLAIFPEDPLVPYNADMNVFQDGFAGLARLIHQSGGEVLEFVPVAVHRRRRAILVGESVPYRPEGDPESAGRRLAATLPESVAELYSRLEAEPS